MASVNKVILVGNLGADPEVRYLPSGDAVANVSIATTDRYKDKTSGEFKESTEWHRVSFFSRLAEIVGEYLKKGSPIYVEGRLQTRKWTDKNNVERYTTEIIASNMQMLGSKGGGSQTSPSQEGDRGNYQRQAASEEQNSSQTQAKPSGGLADMDDDIPF